MFYDKCGSLLKPCEGKMQCLDCGVSKDEGLIKDQKKKTKKIEVMEQIKESYPIIDKNCDKCGNEKVFFWSIQTRSSDEPETQFFKCIKCKHIWREY